jgi:hypothetical protein
MCPSFSWGWGFELAQALDSRHYRIHGGNQCAGFRCYVVDCLPQTFGGQRRSIVRLGLGKTSYWAIGGSPRAQVGSRNTVNLETYFLSSDPITELGFKSLLARSTTGLVVMNLQGLVVLGEEDHGIELTRFFHKHRFAFGLSGQATKTVLGFGGSDAHGGIPENMAILAIRRSARQGGQAAKQFDGTLNFKQSSSMYTFTHHSSKVTHRP